MLHTFGELSDMHFCYDATDGNSTKAQRLYGKKNNETMPSADISQNKSAIAGYRYVKT